MPKHYGTKKPMKKGAKRPTKKLKVVKGVITPKKKMKGCHHPKEKNEGNQEAIRWLQRKILAITL
jgi:hypothetical protein